MLQTLLTDPQNFCGALQVRSPGDHFLSESLSLRQIQTSLGEKGALTVRALLNMLIGDLVMFVNVGKSMTPDQIVKTVDLVIEEYNYFKPEDFKLCFNRAKKGQYGALYDRIDGQLILSWLGEYDNERTAEVEDIRQTQNTQLKKLEAKPLLTTDEKDNADKDELFRKNIALLLERTNLRKKEKLEAEAVRRANTVIDKGPMYDMHQRWLLQFDALWKRQGYPSNRLVRKYGMKKNPFYSANNGQPKIIHRMMDKNEYLEHKQWQYMTFNKL